MKLVGRLTPWLMAVLLLAFLFHRYPLAQVLNALSLANPAYLISFLLTYFLYYSLTDSWGVGKTLSKFGVEGSFLKTLKLRLASNLVMILNYGIGQGVFAYLVSNHFGSTFARTGGVLMFQILADLFLALSISFAGTFFTDIVIEGIDFVPWIRGVWIISIACYASVAIVARNLSLLPWLKWQPALDMLQSLKDARLKDYLQVMAWRLPLHFATSTYLYFLAMCFGVEIPLNIVITLLPLVILVGAVPITPSGIGTVQISAIFLFKDFLAIPSLGRNFPEPAEIIFAMSILFTFSIYILKLVTGFFCLRYATSELKPGKK